MRKARRTTAAALAKAPTGIQGLDEITGGGVPRGRPTLVCGGAGAGKTLFAMEFLVRGATEFGEPGVFMAFEENAEELTANFASLGHDLVALQKRKKLVIDFVRVERSEVDDGGEYDLEGLFIRIAHAIASVGARRVVLDTVEALFTGLGDAPVLRFELRRLFRWLKDRGITAVITAERGEGSLTRYALEEYVADCVILLDNRVTEGMATRRLRIAKYRGTSHGTNDYPFLIDAGGFSILPVTSLGLRHEASTRRVSSGVRRLDAMMGGRGYYRGSSILVSGTAGSGKTSLAAHFTHAAAARGERCLWLALEESQGQIVRNMRSIGIDLEPALRRGLLRLHAERPSTHGLEAHLGGVHKLLHEYRPQVVVVDPLSSFAGLGSAVDVKAMVTRLVDVLKARKITAFFTSLTAGGDNLEATQADVSSIMDTWLLLRDLECGAERNRVLHLLKSRGMAHSNQVREFILTGRGAELQDVYVGSSGALLTGAARAVQDAQETAERVVRAEDVERRQRELEGRRRAVEAQIAALRAGLDVDRTETAQLIVRDQRRAEAVAKQRLAMGRQRHADAGNARKNGGVR